MMDVLKSLNIKELREGNYRVKHLFYWQTVDTNCEGVET